MQVAAQAPSVKDVLLNVIPRNPIQAAAQFDLLPLIFFSVVFGAAISVLPGENKATVISFFSGINDASMIVIGWVMHLAPYAVFALIAAIVSQFGLDLLRSLLIYSLTVILGLALHMFVTIPVLVRFAARLNPVDFFRKIIAVPIFAFSTSSSNATLPLTMSTAENKLGISKEVSSFVLPLGATINMDGTALYQAVAVMFIAQIYDIPMSLTAQATVVLTATLASIGTAGVPSAGIITLIIVLQSVGLGDRVEAGIALILGVDRILDMLRTAVNVTGDLSCAAFISRTEAGAATEIAAAAARADARAQASRT
jgi:Na+/H+-dicarboxylate symporter